MNLKTKLAVSFLMLGSVSVAQAALTTYDVTAQFNEPQAANLTLFTGQFVWDDAANTMTSFGGTMNSSMSVSTATPNLTLSNLIIDNPSSLIGNNSTAGMVTYGTFLDTNPITGGYVFSDGAGTTTGNHMTGNGIAYGNPGSMMMGIAAQGAGTVANGNAYFSLTFDPTAGPMTAAVNDIVYGDCSTAGLMMMGNVCMGGEKNGITMMAGTPLSLNISAVSAVPLPAAAWLFGGALMSLFGANRRKTVLPA